MDEKNRLMLEKSLEHATNAEDEAILKEDAENLSYRDFVISANRLLKLNGKCASKTWKDCGNGICVPPDAVCPE